MSIDNCISCKESLDEDGFCTNQNCKIIYNQRPDQTESTTNDANSKKAPKPKNSSIDAYKNLDEATKQVVMAQDRTTHAVRALVRFLFIQLSAITLTVIISLIANAMDSEFLIVVAGLIYIVGVFWSSNAGWSELEKSNIPK
jgi:hypothetical protein